MRTRLPLGGDARRVLAADRPVQARSPYGAASVCRTRVASGVQWTVHEHVRRAVRVAADEVARYRLERDKAPVRRDRGAVAFAVTLRAVRADADAPGLSALAITHEDISDVVSITRYEVGSI